MPNEFRSRCSSRIAIQIFAQDSLKMGLLRQEEQLVDRVDFQVLDAMHVAPKQDIIKE